MSKDLYRPFLPQKPISGHIGFYPVKNFSEWFNLLPLPLRECTWDPSVKSVIFNTFFSDAGVSGKVEVSTEDTFRALYTEAGTGAQLYTVCGVRLKDGTQIGAKWMQDGFSGAFAIFSNGGLCLGQQGGYHAYLPENCYQNENGEWQVDNRRKEELQPLTQKIQDAKKKASTEKQQQKSAERSH